MTPPGTEAMPFGCVRKRTEAPRPVPPEKRYRSMEMVMRAAKRAPVVTDEYYVDIRCEQCRSGDAGESMLLCDRCDRGYHIFCLRPILARVPSGPWFCPCCIGERQLIMFPLTQTKILDFFRVQKFPSYGENGEIGECAQELRRRKKRSIIFYKKKRRFLAFSPTSDPVRKLEQMQSLATALTALHMDFSNDLSYIPGMVPKSANRAILEKGGMQVLSKEDTETLELCRAMHRRGECPPLMVVFDSQEGFTVVADSHIKDMTLITEYVGDVDYLWNREHDDCDSLMTLLLGKNPSDSLVICPDRCGNIARFINGINNHNREGKKKQNLKCVRYDVRGECRVLLIACRDISKGERLYYDYNGYEHEYPTHHFV